MLKVQYAIEAIKVTSTTFPIFTWWFVVEHRSFSVFPLHKLVFLFPSVGLAWGMKGWVHVAFLWVECKFRSVMKCDKMIWAMQVQKCDKMIWDSTTTIWEIRTSSWAKAFIFYFNHLSASKNIRKPNIDNLQQLFFLCGVQPWFMLASPTLNIFRTRFSLIMLVFPYTTRK